MANKKTKFTRYGDKELVDEPSLEQHIVLNVGKGMISSIGGVYLPMEVEFGDVVLIHYMSGISVDVSNMEFKISRQLDVQCKINI